MTKTTQDKMDQLLEELKYADLEDRYDYLAEKYFISEDGYSDLWKRKKQFHGVITNLVVFYEMWNNRLIARVFFLWQGWKNKKKCKKIVEVQRYLGGSSYKLSRYLYRGNFGTKCLVNYMLYDDKRLNNESDWNVTKNTTLDTLDEIYRGSYYYDTYTENQNAADFIVSKECNESVHKYCAFSLTDWRDSKLFEWLALYEKHPQVEMIAKMNLIWTLETGLNYFRWSKKGLAILGLESKEELKYLYACHNLKEYRECREDIFKYNICCEEKYYAYRRLKAHNIDITKKKIEYIYSSKLDPYLAASLYADYLGFVDKLGLPQTNQIMYPKDLKKEHDDLMKKVDVLASKEKDDRIRNRVARVLKKYRYADDHYIITPANSSEDLINESKELHHCVRTYIDRYSNGITNIFLLRKREDVNSPFFTLELQNKKIIQLRGNHNCAPDEEVISFVNDWAKIHKLTGAYIN